MGATGAAAGVIGDAFKCIFGPAGSFTGVGVLTPSDFMKDAVSTADDTGTGGGALGTTARSNIVLRICAAGVTLSAAMSAFGFSSGRRDWRALLLGSCSARAGTGGDGLGA